MEANTMKNHRSNTVVPENLRMDSNPVAVLTDEDLARLKAAAAALDSDPEFQADYLKSLFVEKMLEALAERGENQTQLAQRWGKTRQYVSKLFREDKRVNFTIETMSSLAGLLGRRLELQVAPIDEPRTSQPTGRAKTSKQANKVATSAPALTAQER
jgi:transcriptional regulator with XRE-family HTH domain